MKKIAIIYHIGYGHTQYFAERVKEDVANRLGSFLGAMAQAGQVAPDQAFVPGDLKTAKMFGENFAKTLTGV